MLPMLHPDRSAEKASLGFLKKKLRAFDINFHFSFSTKDQVSSLFVVIIYHCGYA